MMKQRNEIIMYSIFVVLGLVIIVLLVFTNKNEVYENDVNNMEEVNKQIETDEVSDTLTNDKVSSEIDTSLNKTNKDTNTSNQSASEETNNNNNNNNVEKPATNSASNKPTKTTTNDEDNDNSNNSTSTNEQQQTFSEEDTIVINELNTLEKNMDELLVSNEKSVSDKAKGIFITLVDFCFYDGEIKGYTFNELTDKGKSQVLKIVNRIDEKIEKKFPNYKDNISAKVSKALNKMSELIRKGANNLNDFALDKLGVEYYNNMIEEKDELVKYTKNALDLFKNFGSSLWNKTTTKLKDWYENFKRENSNS